VKLTIEYEKLRVDVPAPNKYVHPRMVAVLCPEIRALYLICMREH
jgi:hypothetical protein